jgi:hypothetical protein
MTHTHRHAIGVLRREFLQVGFSGLLGLSASEIAASADGADLRKGIGIGGVDTFRKVPVKHMILVFLTGAPSHVDTFDMKPEAPEGIRGSFRPISTDVPGMFVSEHLPRLSRHFHKLAVVRSMQHRYNNHLNATHVMLTGHSQPGAFFDKIASRDDYPCYAGTLEHVRPSTAGVPSGVTLPTFLMEGPLVWPGQHAGFLGPKYDPWLIKSDPNRRDFRVEEVELPQGLAVERLTDRRSLSRSLDTIAETLDRSPFEGMEGFDEKRRQAYSMLLSRKVANAFDIGSEPAAMRDRYGRHMFGQSLLLARRLIESGVPIVQANMGRVQNWDSHQDIFRRLSKDLLPPLDQGVTALLEDLDARGLLDETLVIVTGEFGRNPKIGTEGGVNPGRDHWSPCFTSVFAGGGVRGGQYIGASDKNGAYPATRPITPNDFGATVYRALGIDPDLELRDKLDRPIRIVRGEPIPGLFA